MFTISTLKPKFYRSSKFFIICMNDCIVILQTSDQDHLSKEEEGSHSSWSQVHDGYWPDPSSIPLSGWGECCRVSAEVSKDVFVPVAFCLLPDKKKESYQVMFSLLKNSLDDSELELSAEYFMSDFEVAIRDAFLSTFPGIEAKGCAFHFAKAILSKVSRSGFKSDYQNVAEFSAFVRATLGLALVFPFWGWLRQ